VTAIPLVKRGDAVTFTIDTEIDMEDAGYTAGQLFLRSTGTPTTTVTKTVVIPASPATEIEVSLTAEDTAVVGNYVVELELTPGPHTYPTDGYAWLSIIADLG
jgi:hypothetical protein